MTDRIEDPKGCSECGFTAYELEDGKCDECQSSEPTSGRIETVIDEWMDAHGMDDMGLEARDLLDRLKAARIAVVELPNGGVSSDDSSVWHVGNHTINHYLGGDAVIDDRLGIDEGDARNLAAVLLAVDDAAEASR